MKFSIGQRVQVSNPDDLTDACFEQQIGVITRIDGTDDDDYPYYVRFGNGASECFNTEELSGVI